MSNISTRWLHFAQLHAAILLVACLQLPVIASWAVDDGCQAELRHNGDDSRASHVAIKSGKVVVPADIMDEYQKARDYIFASDGRPDHIYGLMGPEAVPTELVVNGHTYKVDLFLGQGGEGQVFLVEWRGRKFVIKKFSDPKQMVKNIARANKLRSEGVNIILPLEQDSNSALVIYPYVDGIPLNRIRRFNELKWFKPPEKQFSISERAREFAAKAFVEFSERQGGWNNETLTGSISFVIHDCNVVLDFKNSELILIDPY